MKTNKEYPATHSMSTTWYAVDVEGNVAVIEFNDNGPIPFDIPQDSGFEDVAFDQMSLNRNSFPQELNYTDEQALEFLNGAKCVDEKSDDMIFYNSFVQIDIDKQDIFLKFLSERRKNSPDYITLMTISKKLGIYYLDAYPEDKLLKRLLDENIIIKYKYFNFFIYDEYRNGKWCFDFNEKDTPFFVYMQPYWPSQLIERIYVPKHPVKIDQISDGAPQIMHLPFKFSEQKLFQIAEFCKSQFYEKDATIDDDGDYVSLPLTNGGSAFFHYNDKKIEFIPIDEAFESHRVVINYKETEYTINGKRGYFFDEEENNYFRIGSVERFTTTENDTVEIFNAT